MPCTNRNIVILLVAELGTSHEETEFQLAFDRDSECEKRRGSPPIIPALVLANTSTSRIQEAKHPEAPLVVLRPQGSHSPTWLAPQHTDLAGSL